VRLFAAYPENIETGRISFSLLGLAPDEVYQSQELLPEW